MDKVEKTILLIISIMLMISIGMTYSKAELVEEIPGILWVDRQNTTPTNVVYTDTQGQLVSEIFHAPEVIIKYGPMSYLTESNTDPGRMIANLPNYGIARWHWWLFGFVLLPQAQKEYGACVDQIKTYQQLLGEYPLIDDELHPAALTIVSVRDYQVPFDALQNHLDVTKPPTLVDAKAHTEAALFSYNITVYHIQLCHGTRDYYKWLVESSFSQCVY